MLFFGLGFVVMDWGVIPQADHFEADHLGAAELAVQVTALRVCFVSAVWAL
jgi:hypothetical protein